MLGRAVAVATVVLVGQFGVSSSWDAPRAAAAECAPSATAAGLDAFFAADDAAGLGGADYPHAYALPDGRTLWLFQDAFVGSDDELWTDRFAHNAALVQSGSCFELLPTSGGRGTSWIGSWVEDELDQWFWPLDAEVGDDGNLWLFLAEVRNPNGSGAARGAKPVATWRARYSLPDLQLVDLEPAADASSALFGYSIVSDDEWTYLYAHCYRQFDPDAADGFDGSCTPYAYLARVPKGKLDDRPEYWSGAGWSAYRSLREPVLTGNRSMPVSVERFGDAYVAASDEGDWFGSEVIVRTAPAPQGPWSEVLRYTPGTKCERCNNYGAFILPRLENDQVVIAQSNNAWDMAGEAFADASLYRIGVRAVSVPGVPGAPLPVAASPSAVEDVEDDEPAVLEVDGIGDEPADARSAPDEIVGGRPAAQDVAWERRATASRSTGPFVVALRAVGLGLAAMVAAAAGMGFASTARRANPARRRRALARVRTYGATRAHHGSGVPAPRRVEEYAGVGAGDGGDDAR